MQFINKIIFLTIIVASIHLSAVKGQILMQPGQGLFTIPNSAITWSGGSSPNAVVFISPTIPKGQLKGIYFIFRRDGFSIDMFIEPAWRTFWSQQNIGYILIGGGGAFPSLTSQVTYKNESFAIRDYVLELFKDAAVLTEYSELSNAPAIWWGHSATSGPSTEMANYVPKRTIAFFNLHGANRTSSINFSSEAGKIPALITGGRLDVTIAPFGNNGSLPFIQAARNAGAPVTGGFNVDMPHGTGIPTVATGGTINPYVTSSLGHLDHASGERTATQLYNFFTRQSFTFPYFEELLKLRLPQTGAFHEVNNPLQDIDQTKGWLGNFPTSLSSVATDLPPWAVAPSNAWEIKSYAAASAQERAAWTYLSSEPVAKMWQFYFSGGTKGAPSSPGVNINTLTTPNNAGNEGLFEISRPATDSWKDGYNNNRTNTTAYINVSVDPSSTAVLGTDFEIVGSSMVSQNLLGRNHVVDYKADPRINQVDIPVGTVKFFDKQSYSYIQVRSLRTLSAAKTVTLNINTGTGYSIGSKSTATILLSGLTSTESEVNSISSKVIYSSLEDKLIVEGDDAIRKVQVIDNLGKVCLEKNYSGTNLTVDTSKFREGVYNIRIFFDNNVLVKKIFLNK